jgi:hypothetical protein
VTDKKIVLIGGTPGPKPEHLRDTYFVGCYTKSNKLRAIKIGTCARGMIVHRLRTLQTGSVDRLVLLGVYNGSVERKLHRMFKSSRLRKNSEFFRPSKELLKLIEHLKQINQELTKLDKQDVVAGQTAKPQQTVEAA